MRTAAALIMAFFAGVSFWAWVVTAMLSIDKPTRHLIACAGCLAFAGLLAFRA